ncbi:MAG: hypothetical protein EOO38_28810, partial [Cytophagaceae bacterium]
MAAPLNGQCGSIPPVQEDSCMLLEHFGSPRPDGQPLPHPLLNRHGSNVMQIEQLGMLVCRFPPLGVVVCKSVVRASCEDNGRPVLSPGVLCHFHQFGDVIVGVNGHSNFRLLTAEQQVYSHAKGTAEEPVVYESPHVSVIHHVMFMMMST